MARLILEEGGDTRRFKLSAGKLTFGSSDKATLTLQSDDVAALHGQIEMSPEGAILRVAKGVTAPKAGGRAISGPHTMKAGQPVTIGGAKLSVEYDEGEGPTPPRSPARTSGRSSARTSAAGDGGDASGGRSRPRPQKSGMPGWVTALLVLVVIVAVAAGLLNMVGGSGFDFNARWNRYERDLQTDQVGARTLLKSLLNEELTPAQKKLVEGELERTKGTFVKIDDTKRNSDINKWLEARVFAYNEKWPVRTDKSHARLFLKRTKWFMDEYPTHPERGRVERLIERVTPVADVGSPRTFADVDVEVWGETAPSPKDYTAAIKIVDDYLASSPDAGDKEKADILRSEVLTAEAEFYEERKRDASVVYDRVNYPDKYEPRTAFNDMLVAVTSMYTPELRADAAKRMLGISEIKPGYYEAFKRDRPRLWKSMMTEPSLRAYAEANGLE